MTGVGAPVHHDRTVLARGGPPPGRGLPPFVGRHLWTYSAVFQVHNPGRVAPTYVLRDLLVTTAPVCYWCSAPWRVDVGSKCPGGPAGLPAEPEPPADPAPTRTSHCDIHHADEPAEDPYRLCGGCRHVFPTGDDLEAAYRIVAKTTGVRPRAAAEVTFCPLCSTNFPERPADGTPS